MSRRKTGDVTIDLGEAIERRLASASGKAGIGRYRPTMGNYRPTYSNRWALGERMNIPKEIKPKDLIGGALIGTAANRLMYRGIPQILATDSELVVNGIAFGAGLIPFLVKPNSLTVGIALPGLMYLTGSVADFALDAVGVAKPALSGSRPGIEGSQDARAKARERLEQIGRKIDAHRPQGRTASVSGRVQGRRVA